MMKDLASDASKASIGYNIIGYPHTHILKDRLQWDNVFLSLQQHTAMSSKTNIIN